MDSGGSSRGNPDYVNSLANGLAVLTAFDATKPSLTISEAAVVTGLTRASARRILLTLSSLGFVRQTGSAFELTPRALSIGNSYLASSGLGDVVSARISELSSEIHESISAAVLDGNEIVYIARSAPSKIMQVRISIGTRFPAAVTSMGRVLLAGLDDSEIRRVLASSPIASLTAKTKTDAGEIYDEVMRVRAQGYALVNQELEIGLKSLAVPIKDRTGKTLAAINIAGVASDEKTSFEPSSLEALKKCASKIQTDLDSF